MDQLEQLINHIEASPRVRFLCLDLKDARRNHWNYEKSHSVQQSSMVIAGGEWTENHDAQNTSMAQKRYFVGPRCMSHGTSSLRLHNVTSDQENGRWSRLTISGSDQSDSSDMVSGAIIGQIDRKETSSPVNAYITDECAQKLKVAFTSSRAEFSSLLKKMNPNHEQVEQLIHCLLYMSLAHNADERRNTVALIGEIIEIEDESRQMFVRSLNC
ncbi:hypothetical protein ACOME3_008858 [Neoechinorhynchus agilis]